MAKAIDVKGQIRLGLARTFRLTVNGVRFRLFRSSVTVVVIAVAIAFLMNILAEGFVKGSIARMTGERIRKGRRASRWASRLSVPGTLEEILHEVARSRESGPVCKEIVNLKAISERDTASYHAAAKRASNYLAFFEGLDHVDRRQLAGNVTGTDVFDRLRDRSAFVSFEEKLAKLRSVSFPTTRDFWSFLEEWSTPQQPGPGDLKERTRRIQGKRAEAIARIREGLAGRTVIDGLAGADGEFGEVVKAAGFVFEAGALRPSSSGRPEATRTGARTIIAEQARRIRDSARLEGTLGKRRARQFIAAEVDVNPAQVNVVMLWKLMRSRRVAARYLERLRHVEQETRLGTLSGAVREFLKELGDSSAAGLAKDKPAAAGKLESVPEGLRARYLKPDGTASSFQDARAGEAVRRLSASARDAWRLVERFRDDAEASGLDSYRSLGKLLEAECVSTDEPQSPAPDDPDAGEGPARVKVKPLLPQRTQRTQRTQGSVASVSSVAGRGVPAYALGVKAVLDLARRKGDEFALARAERATADVSEGGGGILG